MPRKSLALFLAATGLITSLAGCGAGQDANEKGGDDDRSGQPATAPTGQPDNGEKRDEGGEGKQGDNDDKRDKGEEGGEGGEG